METIINPADRNELEKELKQKARFIRKTNKGDNEIYIFDHFSSPLLMDELGRVREITFRAAGGGTGLNKDLDEFDLNETPYQQLIVWDPEDREIIGGYRYILCGKAALYEDGRPKLATTELFHFSPRFTQDYLPYTIELGRSFVQPAYQPSATNRKGLFTLDNLWDGLGAIVVDNPDIKYFFGKVTMYTHYQKEARDLLLSFMQHYFPDPDKLVWPIEELPITHDVSPFFQSLKDLEYKEGHKLLNQRVRDLGENIPPLINSYMNLSPTMRSFGTSFNHHFGDVEETGIMVTIADIYESKKDRHVSTYTPNA